MKINTRCSHWFCICLFLLSVVFFGCATDKPLGIEEELETTKNELNSVRSELSSTKSELSKIESELADAKSELDNAITVLKDTESDLEESQRNLHNNRAELESLAVAFEECQDYGMGVLRIIHDGSNSILRLYVASTSTWGWGDDWLGTETISVNTYRDFGLIADTYDIRAEFSNGQVLDSKRTITGGKLTTLRYIRSSN